MSTSTPLMAAVKPTKSLYRSASSKVTPYKWTLRSELANYDRLVQLLCLVLMPISVGLYAAAITSQDLVVSSGDMQNVAHGSLGYSQICFTGTDTNAMTNATNTYAQDCAHISESCHFTFSGATQSFMGTYYNGQVDSSLSGCSEFNAYRAFHVIGIILAGAALLMMLPLYVLPGERQSPLMKRLRIYTFCVAFMAGVSGIVAQCLFIDWWNTNQQYLVTLGYASEAAGTGSTPGYVTLDHSLFDLVGGWVCALVSSLIFVWTFTSATK